jgi:nicotinamidase-related amidase
MCIGIVMSTALLIVDVQNDYFPGGKMELVESKEASERIQKVLERFRNKNRTIIHIQHIATKKSATFFIEGTEGSEIYKNVKPIAEEVVLQKHYPNSFRDTTLDQYCKIKGIYSLVIVGMMTHMCIDTTTRAAYDLGYTCTVLSDCCATKDLRFEEKVVKAKDVQTSFLAALEGTFAEVISTEEYLNREI